MSRRAQSEVSVFAYQDYREFLKDWYATAKKTRVHFSFRAFAQKAGFHTSNFLLLVMQGRRNLTESSLNKFVLGLELNRQEEEFFRNLVYLNQAESPDEKNHYCQKLLQSKKYNQLKPIERQQYEYYSTWYHPVIRELVCAPDFDGTPEWLSGRLYPRVSSAQCAKSVELLEELGFIRKNGGGWEQTNAIVSTGSELSSLIVHNYHKAILNLTMLMMDKMSTRHRDVSTLTLGVRRERIPVLRDKIRAFRKDVLSMVSTDTAPDDVVQLNIQFFPVTVKTALHPAASGAKAPARNAEKKDLSDNQAGSTKGGKV